jgi:hypothetical protein
MPHSGFWFFLNRYLAFFGNVTILALNFLDLSETVGLHSSLIAQGTDQRHFIGVTYSIHPPSMI